MKPPWTADLGGGFNFLYFWSLIWGNDPIWWAYFSDGLKSPTRDWVLSTSHFMAFQRHQPTPLPRRVFLRKETRAAKGGVGAKGSVERVSWRFVWCEQGWSFGTKKGTSLKKDISSSKPDVASWKSYKFWIEDTSSNGCFSIVMLVFGGVRGKQQFWRGKR